MRAIEKKICKFITQRNSDEDYVQFIEGEDKTLVWMQEGFIWVLLNREKIALIGEGKLALFADASQSKTAKSRLNAMLEHYSQDWRVIQKGDDFKLMNASTNEVKDFVDGCEFAI